MIGDGAHRKLVFRLRPLLVSKSDTGILPADSVLRTLYADAVCYLGAGTALLLQLAHPAIAHGVRDHSDYEHRPLDRLVGTLFAANTVVFGSQADAQRIGAAITSIHGRVQGAGYRALDPQLLCWVNATLLGCAVPLYEDIIGPFSASERDRLAAESRQVGAVFGCPVDAQPGTWSEFTSYWDRAVSELAVSDDARAVAGSLLSGRGLPLARLWKPSLAVARAMTAAALPPRIRQAYGLGWGRRERMLAASTRVTARAVLPRLPTRWRQIGSELLRSAGSAVDGAGGDV